MATSVNTWPTWLQRLREKGEALYHDLREAIALQGNEYKPPPELCPLYNTEIDPPAIPAVYDHCRDMLTDLGLPNNGYKLIQAFNVPRTNHTPYQNYVHEDGKAILCMFNYAHLDNLYGSRRMCWSDIMAACCARVMAASGGGDMSKLVAVVRLVIENKETCSVMRWIAQNSSSRNSKFFDVLATDDGFFPLLATDNGKGVAFMLKDHPRQFGRKIITRARVYPTGTNEGPCICWYLVEVPSPTPPAPPSSSPLSRKQKRHEKRQSRSSLQSRG